MPEKPSFLVKGEVFPLREGLLMGDPIIENRQFFRWPGISRQYRIKTYQRMLTVKGIRQSMSRKGNCPDAAINFFGILKCEFQSLIR